MKLMREDYTHITIVLDRSGSMESCKQDTIGGFNAFLEDQKKIDGKLTVTLVQFDNEFEKLYDFVDINKVKNLDDKTFVPRGGTRLRDALARAIDETGDVLAEMPEAERPARVLVVTLTDGGENASYLCNVEALNNRVKHQEKQYNWDFVFIGADLNEFSAHQSYGAVSIGANSLYAAKSHMADVMRLTSAKIGTYRSSNSASPLCKSALNYSEQEKADLANG